MLPNDWDRDGLWAVYTPDQQVPWDLRRIVHLHRRAGFAATWGELQSDLKDGPGLSIDRVLTGRGQRDGVPDNFELVANTMVRRAVESHDPAGLKAWWLYRMLRGPCPLGERLTLLWHNHFATSNDKVRDVAAMKQQNDTFRYYASAPFETVVRHSVQGPALLVWLDAPTNVKGRPNENLARELMELFTLGIGNYTETDVKEAARALTGWKVTLGQFRDWGPDHDDGEKTILGKTGRWSGADLLRFLQEHPATSRRLAWRLCDWLMGEGAADAAHLEALAAGLRAHNLSVRWGVETVLRSRAFFAEANLGTRVLSPVEFLVGSARALECFDPSPSCLVLGEWAARLGQDLFYPPNVGGWQGGRNWLTTRGVIGRANYAAALVSGELFSRPAPLDGIALARKHGRGRDLDDTLAFYAELLTGRGPDEPWLKRLRTALGPRAKHEADVVRAGLALVLASPEVQMA